AAIVRSIIDLGHNLSLRVVGEGIETDPTLDWLDQAGCDVAQGFLLARPMPLAELTIWLQRHPRRSLAPATPGECPAANALLSPRCPGAPRPLPAPAAS